MKKKATRSFGISLKNPPMNPLFIPRPGDRKLNWRQAKRRYPSLSPYSDYDGDGFINSKDCKPLNPVEDSPTAQGYLNYIKERLAVEKLMKGGGTISKWAIQKQKDLSARLQKARMRVITRKYPVQQRRAMATQKKIVRLIYPVIPASATASGGMPEQGKGIKVTRGRPKGSLDPRYAPYGGVFGYRKYVRAQKAYQRYAAQQQMVQQRMQQPQQVQQVQVPQEVAGATPEYSQFPGYEQQVQQMPTQQIQQQIPTQQVQQHPFSRLPPEREIKSVFKGSGGSPYPAVNSQRPLTPSYQTIQQGYVEDTDLMSGRRYMKPVPRPERWSSR